MTKSKLDPRTAAAEKRMMDSVLKPIRDIDLPAVVKDAADAKALEDMCDDLLKKADAAEKQKD
jgi:hypothetical protein